MLNTILAPLTEEEFFRDYWTKDFLHLSGASDKFREFFDWDLLNRTLEQHWFSPRRLRLIRLGNHVDPSRYLHNAKVDATKLAHELAAGATLNLNCCHEVSPSLGDLCAELERHSHHEIRTNLYASWRRDNGFSIHWDDHDVFVLQVAGRKHWKVWKPTRTHPFRKDVVDTSQRTRPTGPPVWEGIVEQGTFLNIPRGWWHVAYPLDEPSLHLTVAIMNLNGIDLLRWLAEEMMASDTARSELPVLVSHEDRKHWLAKLRTDLLAACDDGVIERFLADEDFRSVSRTRISLPGDAEPVQQPLIRTTRLELAVSRRLSFSIKGNQAVCRAKQTIWRMERDLSESLQVFNDFLPHELGELPIALSFRALAIIGSMVMAGVLRRV